MPILSQATSASTSLQFDYQIKTLLQQGSGKFNEDALLVEDNLFGVFDGASSLKGDLYLGKSGAWWAAHLACAAFSTNDTDLASLADKANALIARGMTLAGVNQDDRLQLWSTSAAVVRVAEYKIEFSQVGDALILWIDTDGRFHLPVPFHNHDQATFERWAELERKGTKDIRSALTTQIEQVRLQRNRDYGVLNGEDQMRQFLRTGVLATSRIKHLLLFTDGMHLSNSRRDLVDFSSMVELFLRTDLDGLHRAVRRRETDDPNCCKFPRFKRHDDIAAISLEFQD